MLMMQAQEPAPYLPHPEALVCLYVPRWQAVEGETLRTITDYSGNRRNLSLVSRKTRATMSDGKAIFTSNTGYSLSQSFTLDNPTLLAVREITAPTRFSYGFGITSSLYALETTSNATLFVPYVFYKATASEVTLSTRSGVYLRDSDYCKQQIEVGERLNAVGIALGGQNAQQHALWSSMTAAAIWSLRLSDAEIKAALRYLETASLEDYLMSRI